jgi:hypothetical protein
MHVIRLSDPERDALVSTLGNVISDLGMEIADTDRLEFRNELKQRRSHLRQVLTRLQPRTETSQPL